ncbi:hypothetical protein [Teichococcus aestuarii]|uniref:hypothetical protein n=1 Tax=Teichococcus aestuarii TaxID=568898 RepID=UPI003622F6F0
MTDMQKKNAAMESMSILGLPITTWDRIIFWSLLVSGFAGAIALMASFIAGVAGYRVSAITQSNADQRIAAANERAASADASAARANQSAEDLRAQAANAQLEQERLRESNLSLQRQLEAERMERLQLEERMGPRKIRMQQLNIMKDELISIPKDLRADIFHKLDAESENYAKQLAICFIECGIKVSLIANTAIIVGSANSGLEVVEIKTPYSSLIVKAMKKAGIEINRKQNAVSFSNSNLPRSGSPDAAIIVWVHKKPSHI